MRAISRTLLVTVGLALLAWSCLSCSQETPPSPDRNAAPRAPTLVVGADAFEWNVVLPLVRRGELPTIAGLMERGVFGELETDRPTLSPILWTSIATGKSPAEHGVRGFTTQVADVRNVRLVNSLDRRTKAVWNVLSDYHRRVAVVGWYVTYPAEALAGVMVSQTQTADQMDRSQGRSIMMGRLVENMPQQVFPPERTSEVMEIRSREIQHFPEFLHETFGDLPREMDLLTGTHWENSRWALEADLTFLAIAEHLAAGSEPFDLLMVYANGADVLGHRFWRHFEPQAFEKPPPAREQDDFGDLLVSYYRFLDARLGRLLKAYRQPVNLILISDHGMHATNTETDFAIKTLPDDMNRVHSGHHRDAPPGVFVAAGPDIRTGNSPRPVRELHRSELSHVGSIYDVAPTLMALAGVPAGRDMRGRVLTEILRHPANMPAPVLSHDDDRWLRARETLSATSVEDPNERERLQQLRALGYVE